MENNLALQDGETSYSAITMPYVNERAAYARNRSFRPHVASLCATGNNRYSLRDRTGYRRWFVFEVLNIVDPYTHPVVSITTGYMPKHWRSFTAGSGIG